MLEQTQGNSMRKDVSSMLVAILGALGGLAGTAVRDGAIGAEENAQSTAQERVTEP
jgi:hypothetical protein